MKHYVYLLIIFFLYSCHLFTKVEILMGESTLKNGDIIKVKFVGYGATTPNVVLVTKKSKNNKESTIGKILNYDSKNIVTIKEIDSRYINVRLTDTSYSERLSNDFLIDLNNKIEPNDGSPYTHDTDLFQSGHKH